MKNNKESEKRKAMQKKAQQKEKQQRQYFTFTLLKQEL
jgi:hypothetical protein